ncbi:MAG: hypothetical protein LBL79_13365 [Prevotella sp.]|jgi:hypothetical protein|nr:hypothetical protein [Prevotella sp.]
MKKTILILIIDLLVIVYAYFFFYSYLLTISAIPLLLACLSLMIITVISVKKEGFAKNEIDIAIHSLVIIAVLLFYNVDVKKYVEVYKESKKPKRVITANYKDDLFYYTLIFRENGDCEHEINGFLGYQEVIKGKYYFKGDTIIFTKKPYNNDFIPDTILIDKEEEKILLQRDSLGNFNKKYDSFNIIENGK